MIRIIGFSGIEMNNKVCSLDERKKLDRVKNLLFSKLVFDERDWVMAKLVSMFRTLSYEDLEEVYSDACLVLWNKLEDDGLILKEESIMSYLLKTCSNVGLHYLRKKKMILSA